jgi:signal transduction histidine kinase
MKIPRIGYALLVLLCASILLMASLLIRQETRSKLLDFQDKGTYLINLMALYPINDYKTVRREHLMRTISENISHEGFLYFFVHDQKGAIILSMAPGNVSSAIPPDILNSSLYNTTMMKQQFKMIGTGEAVYEFTKPIFDGGKKTGTIRLGMRPPVVSIFSQERLSLLALMVFFIIAALILGYYGILLALKKLRALSGGFSDGKGPVGASNENTGSNKLLPVIESLEQSLHKGREQLQQIKTDNLSLASRLGVTTFEKNQIAKILDAISFGIIVTDIHNNVMLINHYMLNILGKKSDAVLDCPLSTVLNYPDILSYLSKNDDAVLRINPNPIETVLVDVAPGERFQVAITYLIDDKQELIGKMISVRNVTAARMVEESKQQFIAHVAHELLTPLTNIKSYSEMLMDGEVSNREMQREFYNTINGETDRLARLVQNLLNISKMEMGSLTINKGLVRTDWFVDTCLSAIEASAKDKHLSIETRMPDNFPVLMADKELIKGAVINILGNALKYTPEHGKITFAIDDQGDAVTFEVIDTGYGIAPEDLPHIFEKFYRSGNPDITSQAGSGLGLAITAEIVHLHGGEIDVKSQPGEGSHVTIRIPKEKHYLGKE